MLPVLLFDRGYVVYDDDYRIIYSGLSREKFLLIKNDLPSCNFGYFSEPIYCDYAGYGARGYTADKMSSRKPLS
jgi:hypothetical protein